MPSFVKVCLRGHTMSFGGEMVSPKWRGTNDRPTMSFVIGFLCSCMGIPFRRALSEVRLLRNSLKIHTIILSRGRREVDFQTAGTSYDLADPFEKMCRVIKPGGGGTSDIYKKELLVDAKFDIILEVENGDLSNRIVEALKNPQWFPFIGRKSNHLSDMPFGGVYDSLEKAIENQPTPYPKGTVWIQHVSTDAEKSEPIKDYPLCEGDNRNTVRYVRECLI